MAYLFKILSIIFSFLGYGILVSLKGDKFGFLLESFIAIDFLLVTAGLFGLPVQFVLKKIKFNIVPVLVLSFICIGAVSFFSSINFLNIMILMIIFVVSVLCQNIYVIKGMAQKTYLIQFLETLARLFTFYIFAYSFIDGSLLYISFGFFNILVLMYALPPVIGDLRSLFSERDLYLFKLSEIKVSDIFYLLGSLSDLYLRPVERALILINFGADELTLFFLINQFLGKVTDLTNVFQSIIQPRYIGEMKLTLIDFRVLCLQLVGVLMLALVVLVLPYFNLYKVFSGEIYIIFLMTCLNFLQAQDYGFISFLLGRKKFVLFSFIKIIPLFVIVFLCAILKFNSLTDFIFLNLCAVSIYLISGFVGSRLEQYHV